MDNTAKQFRDYLGIRYDTFDVSTTDLQNMKDKIEERLDSGPMQRRKSDRGNIYQILEAHLPDDEIKRLIVLIADGIDAIQEDEFKKVDSKDAAKYDAQKKKIEKLVKECDLFDIAFKLKLIYIRHAEIKISDPGGPKKQFRNIYLKYLHSKLTPYFDQQINSPQDNFHRDRPTSIELIKSILFAFHRELLTNDAISHVLSRKVTY